MSKKAYDILSLSKSDFIAELNRDGSRVSHAPEMWTYMWLKNRNIKFVEFDNCVSGVDPRAEHRASIRNCVALIEDSCEEAEA